MVFGERMERMWQSPEQEAADKIRDWLHDPKLKFHFSRVSSVKNILEKGVLSHAFAERIGSSLRRDLTGESDEELDGYISIADREKNFKDASRDDWWQHVLVEQAEVRVGFLLPSDLTVSKITPHPHESLVPIRIRPNKIEGIFVVDHESLHEPLSERLHIQIPNLPDYSVDMIERYASDYFGLQLKDFGADDQEINTLRDQGNEIVKRHQQGQVISPDEARLFQKIKESISHRRRELAKQFLENEAGKQFGVLTKSDFLITLARRARKPLYVVDSEFKQTGVIWPKV